MDIDKKRLLSLFNLAEGNPRLKAAMEQLTDVLKSELQQELKEEVEWEKRIHPEIQEFIDWLSEHRNHEEPLGYYVLRHFPELKPHEEWVARVVCRLLAVVLSTETKALPRTLEEHLELQTKMETLNQTIIMVLQYCRWKSIKVREENAKLMHPASIKLK